MTAPTKRKNKVPERIYEVELPDGVETEVNKFTGKSVPVIPKGFNLERANITPQEVVARFHLAFELIGGVERFSLWANENPTDFYKIYGKLLPSADIPQPASQAIQINLSGGAQFPHSPLDDIELRPEVTDAEVIEPGKTRGGGSGGK